MTATVILSKTPNTNVYEGGGFIVTFYDDSLSAVVMNQHGDERILRGDEEVGVYGDNEYVIYVDNGNPVLELIAYDDVAEYEE